jgi:hypothetical protein
VKPFLSIALFAIAAASAFAQPVEIPFESVPNAVRMPEGMYIGEASGVAINSKKHIFVYSRGNSTGPAYAATASQLLEFDPTGKFIREIGHNLYAWSFAHAVRIDKDDNIWAIDKGSDMIIKFDPQGRVMMVFGRKKEASDEAGPWTRVNPPRPAVDAQFRQPTDVAWDPQGNIFISDGYINSRVGKMGEAVGRARARNRSVQHSAQHRRRRQGQRLCRRSRQPSHSGFRSGGHLSALHHHQRSRSPRCSAVDGSQADARTGQRKWIVERRHALVYLHYAAGADAVSVRLRRVSRPRVQDGAGWNGARLSGNIGPSAKGIRLDS